MRVFLFAMVVVFISGCITGDNYKKNVSAKIDLCMYCVKQKDWRGLYRQGNMGVVQKDTEDDFLNWGMIKSYWSTDKFRLDDYEILGISSPTPSLLRQGIPQVIATVKMKGFFIDNRDTTGLMMTFMKKDGKWCLYALAEIPDLDKPLF